MNNNANPAPVYAASTHVVTGPVRLSYCNLVTPRAAQPGAEEKYSVTVLVPKADITTKAKIDNAIEAATQLGVSKKWNGQRPPMVPNPVYDGDGTRPSDGMPFGEECHGHWVFTASSSTKPRIVDANLNDIMDNNQIYSGMYGRVAVDFYPYYNANKRGIGCGLVNVQKLSDGEPLGGSRTSAEDDFGDGYVPAAPAPAPTSAPAQNYQTYTNQPVPTAPQPPVGRRYNPLTGQYE